MSDTPEIDSTIVQRLCIHKRDGSIQHMELIDAEVARKLKRERDEARTTIEDAKRALNATDYEGILLAALRVKEERDELAALLAAEKSTRNSIIEKGVKTERERDEVREKYDTLAVENMLEVNKLCKERDDINNQLIHLRSCVYDVIHSLKSGAFDELEKAWKEGLK
jgi:uncharacterized coiled-coil DUF342 family protein